MNYLTKKQDKLYTTLCDEYNKPGHFCSLSIFLEIYLKDAFRKKQHARVLDMHAII
jgi:hypothetical protein